MSKYFQFHLMVGALVFLLSACSAGLLPAGSGNIGGSLDQGGPGGAIGSGAATGDNDDAASGEGNAGDDGEKGSTFDTANIPLDTGVLGPPTYDYPGTPPQVFGEIKILCKTKSLVKMRITGSARHDPPYDAGHYIDYEPNRTVRIHDATDDKCLEVPLTAAENSTPLVPKNHFEMDFFTSIPVDGEKIKLFVSSPNYVSPEASSVKHDCGGSVPTLVGKSLWTKLLSVGMFLKFDYETQLTQAPNCQIDLAAEGNNSLNL